MGPALLRQQVYRALAQPGGNQDRSYQVPDAVDPFIPSEGAEVRFAETADGVQQHTDAP